MIRNLLLSVAGLLSLFGLRSTTSAQSSPSALHINPQGYYEADGVNVMVFDDFYPEGHQGGLTLFQCGTRLASNGDVRLEPTPGQWAPIPVVGERKVDGQHGTIAVQLSYPDPSKDRKGYNPIIYPDLNFRYAITTFAEGGSVRVVVDLDKPLPAEWADKVGFNLEIFPGEYFGAHYLMDGRPGIFTRQANGPVVTGTDAEPQAAPLAIGKTLVVAPDQKAKSFVVATKTADLQLLDERNLYNNGWFVLRSTIPAGVSRRAVEWVITPTAFEGWRSAPVVQVSQVGYHPRQTKFAVIELDKHTASFDPVQLVRVLDSGTTVVKSDASPVPWGEFLRYKYLRFDFSDVSEEGLYKVKYGTVESNTFEIKKTVYAEGVWQPTLECFLPVQMCHMEIRDRYKVWHGLCHMDDALMAPTNHNHFDGYYQGESTLTKFKPGEHVPGLNIGGWHDAGDYDLRVESQAETIYKLALAYEFFRIDDDQTSVNQETRVVELHHPDGRPDIIEQIEHGALSIVGGYKSMDRLYRGIIEPTLQQYVHLGDASTITDNLIYNEGTTDPILHHPLPKDDRWVFTEEEPRRELFAAQSLAATGRVLRPFNPALADDCIRIAEALYNRLPDVPAREKVNAAAELYLTTKNDQYKTLILANTEAITSHVEFYSETLGRTVAALNDPAFTAAAENAVAGAFKRIQEFQKQNPYGVPYRPNIWGAGWEIQSFGVRQLFLHLGFPKQFPAEYAFNALNFVLGCHPGENTASFVSGVGSHSLTVAYGVNRDEWSYIPGGVGSGTALIRPDFPELKTWPYFWQQSEYVLGGGTVDFLILARAADVLFNK